MDSVGVFFAASSGLVTLLEAGSRRWASVLAITTAKEEGERAGGCGVV